MIRHLPKGEPGTFDHEERDDVPLDVIRRTLPFASPTVQAMIQTQYLTGMRPSEVCKMTVERIDRTQNNGLWYYQLGKLHKTAKHIGKKSIPLSEAVQKLIGPYLVGKKAAEAVFSPRQAVRELNEQRRVARKTKISPSQAERNRQRTENPKSRVGEFYDAKSYYRMVKYLIARANRAGENIPPWFPYQIRHSAATADAMESILKLAQERLGHTTTKMTENYAQVKSILENMLALTQDNPFAKIDS
jgi:integrase